MSEELQKLKQENEFLKKELEKFRNIRANQKQGMVNQASKGNIVSRPAFGYYVDSKGKLIPAQNHEEVREIFEEFLEEKITLRKLAKKHNLSVNGLKKILTNFTYIGKIKFDNQIFSGSQIPLISSTLFNHVQNKLEKLKIKNPNA